MKKITLREYNALHTDFRGVWDVERTDWPEWPETREKYWGKRTMLDNENGATVLLVEGLHFEITSEEEFYSQTFTCGKYYLTRNYLESLPLPFCMADTSDELMQRIVDAIHANAAARLGIDESQVDPENDEHEFILILEMEKELRRHNIPCHEDLSGEISRDDNLKITPDSGDTIDIFIDPVKMPDIFRRKVKCRMMSGISKEEAERLLLKNPIQLELFYDIGRGMFAVEAEAVDSTPIFNPYTGDEIPLIED